MAAGVVSAIALAAAGPASRLATWEPDRSPLQLSGATTVGDQRLAAALVLAQLPPPFGADAVPLPTGVAIPTWVPQPVAPSPAPPTAPPVASPPAGPPPTVAPSPAAPAPAPRRQPPAALGPGSATRSPQPPPRAPVPVPIPTAPPPPPVTARLDGPSAQTLSALNQARSTSGLSDLRPDAALTRAALEHAAQIAAQGQMTHTGYVDDVNSQGVSWQGLGEVLGAYAQAPDPAVINQLWLQSAEHRPILLDPQYRAVGVGWVQSSSGWWYVAAIFMY
ncbi:MAG TPA: CAP domain-containing protein [Candidatus Dormibacteraeota bacterium]